MEGVPERIGLGHADMLNSSGFVFHENSLCSHPCGAQPDGARPLGNAQVAYGGLSSEGSSTKLLVLDPWVPQVSYLSGP